VSALGLFIGLAVAARLTRRIKLSRDGFTLSYQRIEPTATGYRELSTLVVEDLLRGLRDAGYEPTIMACDSTGEPRGPLDPTTPLAGANVAIRDRGVRGYVRLQLAPPPDGQARAMGACEIWSERGDSAEELALFTLRALDPLVGELRAVRETSRLSEDPVKLLTAGLGERPVYRR